MSEEGVLAPVPWGIGVGSIDAGPLAAGLRVSHLVRQAMTVLESDCQGARRCLNDVLALLRPQPEQGSADDPLARGVFGPGGLARWQARRTLTYIDGHLESKLDVPMLAGLVSFSKSHFSRAFKQSLGLPPMTYVTMRRLERAMTLMTSTSQQLTEIALICGFADQSHLNRSFRRVIGVSPGRWRRTRLQRAGTDCGASDESVRLRAGGAVGARAFAQ